jgi:hypothetical protein
MSQSTPSKTIIKKNWGNQIFFFLGLMTFFGEEGSSFLCPVLGEKGKQEKEGQEKTRDRLALCPFQCPSGQSTKAP